MHEAYESPLFDLYTEVSGKPRGQGTGLLRDVIIADTDEEAMALWEDSGRFSGRAWFEPFGFRRGLMDPVTKNFATAKESIDLGYALVGTVDTVTRALEANMKRQPIEWLFCYTYNALVPHSKLMKSTEALWTKVLPKFM
jgi:alkanesulfonate monooxygenase SsuD/methylene tetrahydromethanopterin reductase-like flavin-dependent oxidoreductase (luciferase family)